MSYRPAFVLAGFLVAAVCAHVQVAAGESQADNEKYSESQAFFGVRVLKRKRGGHLDWSVQLPTTCETCRLQLNEFTSGEDSTGFFFHFFAPADLKVVGSVRVLVDPSKVRGVMIGRTDTAWDKPPNAVRGPADVAFTRTRDGITFDVPHDVPGARVPPYDAGDVTEEYTYIETPGVQLRVEHADERRRRGPYATGYWPAAERQAALNLEFAAREAMTLLGLDHALQLRGIGLVTLMGFDTDYPTQGPNAAHDDDPPHWHMHMYWSEKPRVRQIGHFYIDPDGLLRNNEAQNVLTHQHGPLERGQPYQTLLPDGEVLYSQTITAEGYFVLASSDASCRFTPVTRGFQSGVDLACDNGAPQERISAEDDLSRGRLRLFLNDRLAEEHFYDPDTGALKRSSISYEGR